MSSRGVAPDVISFNAALSACQKGMDWQRALSLLKQVPAWRLEPMARRSGL